MQEELKKIMWMESESNCWISSVNELTLYLSLDKLNPF